jgi:decaprenylphospho-beta-D-erythro-pentofuranosid-2-ulose 2-reductase
MDALGEPQSVLVLGGASRIAEATVRGLVAGGARRVVLAGRHPEAMLAVGARVGAEVEPVEFDADQPNTHGAILADVFSRGDIDLVLVAFGLLGDQRAAEADPDLAIQVARTNYLGALSACLHVANHFRRQGHGTLVMLSSVAAERARRSNFIYGSTKAGIDALAQGLGDALQGTGARVMIVRPGFVRTPMTAGRREVPFTVDPDEVAGGILQGLQRGSEIIWVPPALRVVMVLLRHLPRAVFRRLPL